MPYEPGRILGFIGHLQQLFIRAVHQATNTTGNKGEIHRFFIEDAHPAMLTETFIANHTRGNSYFQRRDYQYITVTQLQIGLGSFQSSYNNVPALVSILITNGCFELTCDCGQETSSKMCVHQALALNSVVQSADIRVFFDKEERQRLLKKVGADYGLEETPDLEQLFELSYAGGQVIATPKQSGLIAITPASMHALYDQLLQPGPQAPTSSAANTLNFIVIRQHKYYGHLCIDLYHAPVSRDGKIKNPLQLMDPFGYSFASDNIQDLKFYAALQRFQQANPDSKRSQADITALRTLLHMPGGYTCYYHDPNVSEQITASSVVPTKVALLSEDLCLEVERTGDYYGIQGFLTINGKKISVQETAPCFTYFVLYERCLYLINSLHSLSIIGYLRQFDGPLWVHRSRYPFFQARMLTQLENKLPVKYNYVERGDEDQLIAGGFKEAPTRLLYLTDSGNHVLLTPVMRYGEIEIPVRTKRQIYTPDAEGTLFSVDRQDLAEIDFIALLVRQHSMLPEQLENDLDHFYLPRQQFLDADWFLDVFDEWRSKDIVILGFSELEGNKLNAHKARINIRIESGFNWFNALVSARFGKRKATLKQLHKAIRNRSKYVQLDDGSLGILPEQWMERFSAFFQAGDISDEETLQIPRINYAAIDQLYEYTELDMQVRQELQRYQEQMADMGAIREVPVPNSLQATLRPYQRFGLNWLNALDDLSFGGCLADDMGLGKTVQIIAFLLLLQEKHNKGSHLLVVPTSLLGNWQQELARFAPSLRVLLLYGTNRHKNKRRFDDYDVIITSYGTLTSDIGYLQSFKFDYVFLDESQQIKNPDAQRYKAAQLLQSRNRIVITGTPIENNTFDLYAQLSFACPGLLGSKQYFRDIYAIPVDQFKISKRARELHEKIRPFLLRRTKQQVAPELPEKTEMVLYCPMQAEQRRIYDAYEKEFRDYISATSSDEVKKNPMHALKGLTRLRQICDAPMLLPDDLLRCEASAKIDALMEQIRDKAPRHKLLVFSQFVSMLDLIKKELVTAGIGFAYLTGASRKRQAIIDDFQNNDQTRVFLISLKAGGTGLNLTAADYVYLVDPWWNPAVENQAIDRAHRIGQDKHVVAVRLICPGTVEEKMLKMQAQKLQIAQELIAPDNSALLSREGLLSLLNNADSSSEEEEGL